MALLPLDATEQVDALLAADTPAWIFKHSNACPVSTFAQVEVDRYVASHPTVDVHRVIVQTHRPVSGHVESVTGVKHESPQALLVRDGEVLWHASHGAITEESLDEARRSFSDHR